MSRLVLYLSYTLLRTEELHNLLLCKWRSRKSALFWLAKPARIKNSNSSHLAKRIKVTPTYFKFEFRHIQPPLESSFNRLVCSWVYRLSTLNLFIVCSLFYPIVDSAWTKVTCAFFYCRISGPPWTRTRNAEATILRTAALPIPLTDP